MFWLPFIWSPIGFGQTNFDKLLTWLIYGVRGWLVYESKEIDPTIFKIDLNRKKKKIHNFIIFFRKSEQKRKVFFIVQTAKFALVLKIFASLKNFPL